MTSKDSSDNAARSFPSTRTRLEIRFTAALASGVGRPVACGFAETAASLIIVAFPKS